MYNFVFNIWVAGKITESQVNSYATKGFITEEEAAQILGTPQN